MKKIIPIFLLLLLGLNSIGLYPVFRLIQLHTREVAENIIKKGSLDDLVVFPDLQNNREVKWLEENKEFSFRGKMYDVAKEETEDGISLFYCYDDKKETGISDYINTIVGKQLSDSNHSSGNAVLHLMLMLIQVFVPGEQLSFSLNHPIAESQPRHQLYAKDYVKWFREIPAPPPWA